MRQQPFQRHYLYFILVLVLSISFLRGIRVPNAYNQAHWFFTYEFGFIKRGLIGTVFQPLFQQISSQSIVYIVFFLSLLVVVLFYLQLFMLGSKVLKIQHYDGFTLFTILAFVTSPSLVYLTHCIGNFDNLIFLMLIACSFLVLRNTGKALFWAALLNVAGVMVHETYVICCLPFTVFLFAYIRKIKEEEWKAVLASYHLYLISVPPLSIALLLTMGHDQWIQENSFAFITSFLKNRVVYPHHNVTMLYALTVPFEANYLHMKNIWASRTGEDIAVMLYVFLPTTLLLVCTGIHQLNKSLKGFSSLLMAAAFLLVCFAPQALHVIAWDMNRIASFSAIVAFIALSFLILACKGAYLPIRSYYFSAPIILFNLTAHFELFDGYRVKHYPAIFTSLREELQKLKLKENYTPTVALLFENADFEHGNLSNWHAEGDAFMEQPTFGDNPLRRNAYAVPQGNWWISTYEKNPNAGLVTGDTLGAQATGKLISTKFRITDNKIGFLISGGNQLESAYVAFYVNGQELGRFTGYNNQLMVQRTIDVSPYLGQEMHIEIVDHSTGPWGYINADAFGYLK